MKLVLLLTYAVASLTFAPLALAQQADVEQGIALYKSGDDAGAIRFLEKAVRNEVTGRDAEAWNTLGLAYLSKDNLKKAVQSLERAVELKPTSSAYHGNLAFAYLRSREVEKSERATDEAFRLDPKNAFAAYVVAVRFFWMRKPEDAMAAVNTAILHNPRFGMAYLLRSDILVSMFGKRLQDRNAMQSRLAILADAIETLKIGIQKAEKKEDKTLLETDLSSMTWFHAYYSEADQQGAGVDASAPGVNVTPYRVTYQPVARYTVAARSNNIEGAVRLAILLEPNGKVGHILKLFGLGFGLDEAAIQAAKKIKFIPKKLNGKPVPAVIIREYTFDIY